jgi:hypothetical protein
MIRTLTALALAALAVSPAFAQTTRDRVAPQWTPPPIVEDGQYRGNDPDPAVRMDLRRDNQSYRGG